MHGVSSKNDDRISIFGVGYSWYTWHVNCQTYLQVTLAENWR